MLDNRDMNWILPHSLQRYKKNKMASKIGDSFRSHLTKWTSSTKNLSNKIVSGLKHKGNISDVPDEMFDFLYIGIIS